MVEADLDTLASRIREMEGALAIYDTALTTLTEKRITDGEGWATWAKNVARRAVRARTALSAEKGSS